MRGGKDSCGAERKALAMIKLIVSDFDGTVLPFGEKQVSAEWKQAVKAALAEGVSVAIASGRTYGELVSFLPEFREHIWFICCDGAYTVRGDRVVYAKPMAVPDIEVLLRKDPLIRGFLLHGAFRNYAIGSVPASMLSQFSAQPIRSPHAAREPIFKLTSFGGEESPELPTGLRMHWDGGRDAMAQYVHRFADKGLAVSDLQNRLLLGKLGTACVGDSGNDVAMMRNAVIPIAVRSRSDELTSLSLASLPTAELAMELIRRVNERLRTE